jgi:hypothetical protein
MNHDELMPLLTLEHVACFSQIGLGRLGAGVALQQLGSSNERFLVNGPAGSLNLPASSRVANACRIFGTSGETL